MTLLFGAEPQVGQCSWDSADMPHADLRKLFSDLVCIVLGASFPD